MENVIRWGVLGAGGIARRRTIPEGIIASPNSRLVSVYDLDEKVNRQVAEQFGAASAGSVEELLATDIDAVYIATPVEAHFHQTIACADAGKHVLCEKPLGLNSDQARKMYAACRQNKVLLGTALMMRFHAQHQALRDLVREGKLGIPVFARAQLSCWYPPIPDAWRQDRDKSGGGAMADMGVHCVDVLEMLFGKVTKVSCMINNIVHRYDVEDSAVAMLYFENGATGVVDTFFCVPDQCCQNALEVYGSKGSVIAKGTISQSSAGQMTAFLEEHGESGYDARQARQQAGGVAIAPDPVNMYRAEIENFCQAIIHNQGDADGGLHIQKVLSACYRSAKTGKAVTIDI